MNRVFNVELILLYTYCDFLRTHNVKITYTESCIKKSRVPRKKEEG